MTTTLTRLELFELIWSRPRSKLAAEFGISDVAIGKHCARARVPGPPPGYWAKTQAGKGGRRPHLPLRLPGHPREVAMGSNRYRYWEVPPEDLNEPLHPPEFLEDVGEQVAAALKQVGRVSASRDLSTPHRALNRVLASEAKRRDKYSRDKYDFYKPYFDDEVHQRQLRIFNSIAHALTPVTASQDVQSDETWIQGIGTPRFLKMSLNFGDVSVGLEFIEPGDGRTARNVKGFKAVTATTLRAGNTSSSLEMVDWTDQPDDKIERQLGSIVEAILSRAERLLRVSAQERFEWRVKRRLEMEKEREAAERAKEAARLEAIAVHRKKVRQQIVSLAGDWRAACDIRDMVAALSTHPDLTSSEVHTFDEWRVQALGVADQLDPMKRSLDKVIAMPSQQSFDTMPS